MDPTTTSAANLSGSAANGANATPSATVSTDARQAGSGNPGLQEAFNSAIEQAQQTLEITTKNGAILYSLKQSVR